MNPGRTGLSVGSPWKMFVIPFSSATQSTLPCHVLTWNMGILPRDDRVSTDV